MATYTFPPLPAIDPETGALVLGDSEGQIFAVSDTSFATPLTVRDLSGVPMASVRVSATGLTQAFQVDDHPEVIWKSGEYVVFLVSTASLVQLAEDSRDAAEASRLAAERAAANAVASTQRKYSPTTGWPARSSFPGVVTCYSTLSVLAPAPDGQLGDLWFPHPASTAAQSGGLVLTYNGSIWGSGTGGGTPGGPGGGEDPEEPGGNEGPVPFMEFGLNEGSGTTSTGTTGKIAQVIGTWTTGKYGSAVVRPADPPYAITAPAAALGANPSAFSIMAWVNLPNVTQDQHVVIAWSQDDLAVLETKGTQAGVAFRTSSGVVTAQGGTLTPGWHHLAATFDAGAIKVYADGVQVATASGGANLVAPSGNVDITAGGYYWSSTSAAAPVDEIRLFGEALTASQISSAMTTPVGQPIEEPEGPITDDSVMPTGPVTSNGRNWTQLFAEDFNGATRPSVWNPYGDGWGGGKYVDSTQVTYHDGMMDIHVENKNGVMAGTGGKFGETQASSMRTAIRFRTDKAFSGAGCANMLWPTNDVWGEGEIDWPEIQFDANIMGFIHEMGANPQNNAVVVSSSKYPWNGWNTAVTEWVAPSQGDPGYVRLYLNDVLVGQTTTHVPTTPHDWRFQAADNTGARSNGGHFLIAWVAAWKLAA